MKLMATMVSPGAGLHNIDYQNQSSVYDMDKE